ncbi:MAG: GNAT family N-acetyltransferase [Ignavibacteria bacterium]|nr:GNAT family N-acetyltransferase [Ignavibacteria bacterium]
MYNVLEADYSYNSEIEKFLLERPSAKFYHLPKWLEILETESNQKGIQLICTNKDGKIVGYFPFLFTKGWPFNIGGILAAKRLASPPRTPVAGPVSENDEVLKKLLKATIEITHSKNNLELQIKTDNKRLAVLNDKLQCVPWKKLFIKEIPERPNKIEFLNSNTHKRVNNALKKAKENNVQVREGESKKDLQTWYKTYCKTMRFHAVHCRSLEFFENLWDGFYNDGFMSITLVEQAKYPRRELLTGTIKFKFKDTTYGPFIGSRRKYFKFRINDLLCSYEFTKAQEEGYKFFNIGEVQSNHPGLEDYKRKWGVLERDVYHYYRSGVLHELESIDHGNYGIIKKKIWRLDFRL